MNGRARERTTVDRPTGPLYPDMKMYAASSTMSDAVDQDSLWIYSGCCVLVRGAVLEPLTAHPNFLSRSKVREAIAFVVSTTFVPSIRYRLAICPNLCL
jgi:hypothetical protein